MPSANDESSNVKNVVCTDIDSARKPLARLRCLKECVNSLQTNSLLPAAICYVPAEITYNVQGNEKLVVYSSPMKDRTKLEEVNCTREHRIVVSGEELYTDEGQWAKLIKITNGNKSVTADVKDIERWILIFSSDLKVTAKFKAESSVVDNNDKEHPLITEWDDVVEHEYALCLEKKCQLAAVDTDSVNRMRENPSNWTFTHYEHLAQLLCAVSDDVANGSANVGDVKQYIDNVMVSSQSDDDTSSDNLTDNDPSTYWETDGGVGSHWIKLSMKSGTIIKKLMLMIHGGDDNYIPRRIIVMGGTLGNLRKLNETKLDDNQTGMQDVVVLADQTEYLPSIEIRIKECQDSGIDVRIHGIKLLTVQHKEIGLSFNVLQKKDALIRYPKLEEFSLDILYLKSLLLLRLMKLIDSVLPFLTPRWQHSVESVLSLEMFRELLPLSKKRHQLVNQFLLESESGTHDGTRKVYIDRRAAMEHRSDPSLDPEARNSVFCQLFESLKPHDSSKKSLDYRWPARFHQWWECKFIGEGIIDQGGGFRDSLSDVADELCPSSDNCHLSIPYFIRSPNQLNANASGYRDLYVANPSCTAFHHYEWIGKLMGACFRGKENLVLSLSPFVWKSLCGQTLSWSKDFLTVDEAQVKLLESMKSIDEEGFRAYFDDELLWNATLSNGNTVQLKPANADGSVPRVHWNERLEYIQLVKQTRMNESSSQIQAIRKGLLQVIPQAALDLFTWNEIEKRICGDPQITVEALKQSIVVDEMRREDQRVKFLWEVLEKFSNEERSRFLRFVTGRRRLPAPMHVLGDDGRDCLPTASTCGSTLMLPQYSSAEMMEDKLRYAAYNCIAIDTDTSAAMTFDDY